MAVGTAIAVQTGVNIWRLWKLGDRVPEMQKQVAAAEKENQELATKLDYVKSPEFVEKEARDKLGYGKPGETIIVIPEQDKIQDTSSKIQGETEANWRRWVKLYIGL
jgi:cell division protein FtsB